MTREDLLHYRIMDELGSGGMGSVYRAHDEQLNRDVAIKFLASELLNQRGSMARFKREARILAALNHPNIASIYEFDETDSAGALVMELVVGETLAARISRGKIPLREALPLALQTAKALEYAHEQGVVHRDLKPANITIKQDGTVKVLDFGLAIFHRRRHTPDGLEPSTTASNPGLEIPVFGGTPAYMSPEQARGGQVDERTDVWAFGLVVYEALTGRCPFRRSTAADSVAAIVKEDLDWAALPQETPAAIVTLLRRCLVKDPHDRLHAIGDARLEIEQVLSAPARDAVQHQLSRHTKLRWIRRLAWGLPVLAATIVGLTFWKMGPKITSARLSSRFSILLPSEAPMAPASAMPLAVGRTSIALSPDGTRLVYVARIQGHTGLYVRDMERGDFHAIPGTDGAHSPFFSPDGKSIGFFANDKLMRVALSGEQRITLCDATLGFGGSWGSDGAIYFSTDYSSGLYQVSENGGTPKAITGKEWAVAFFPQVLPQNRGILFSTGILFLAAYDFHTGKEHLLGSAGSSPHFSPTGHILFARHGTVQAAPFDLQQLRITGSPIQLFDGVRTERDGAAQFAFAGDGTFVYAAGSDGAVGTLILIDRAGSKRSIQGPVGDFSAFRVSPDGTRVAIPVNTRRGTDIWLFDSTRGTSTRLTVDNQSTFPLWSPDGKAIYYISWHDGPLNVYRKLLESGQETQVTHWQGVWGEPLDVSPDGKSLLIDKGSPDTRKDDLWIVNLSGGDSTNSGLSEIPFLATPFTECLARFSPDARWVAYTSDESGGWEVYVTSFPHPGERIRISNAGGEEPIWSPSGKELYYRFGTRWFVVDVSTGDRFVASRPRLLFEGPFANLPGYSYEVLRNGESFLVVEGIDQTKTVTELKVVTNIFDEIKRRTSSTEK